MMNYCDIEYYKFFHAATFPSEVFMDLSPP